MTYGESESGLEIPEEGEEVLEEETAEEGEEEIE